MKAEGLSYAAIGAVLGRNADSVRVTAARYGLTAAVRRWTAVEDARLRHLIVAERLSLAEAAARLRRTRDATAFRWRQIAGADKRPTGAPSRIAADLIAAMRAERARHRSDAAAARALGISPRAYGQRMARAAKRGL